jgi:ATP-dependent Lhr-like helicase
MSWQIVDTKNDVILVEPEKSEGIIPSWMGEEIPVPFEVAQKVGICRRTKRLPYPVDDELVKEFTTLIEKLEVIPHDNLISIEQGDAFVIINGCFGTKVNETLAQLLGGLITARVGESVNVHVDPYRIVIESSISADEIKELLCAIDPETVHILLDMLLKNSVLFKKQFFHVAKKFGVIEKDARSVNLPKLIEILATTPLYKEALSRTIYEKLDVKRTREVLEMIRTGKIDVKTTRLSEIGLLDLESKVRTIVPRRAEKSILLALKERIMNEDIILACMNCRNFRRFKVKNITEIKCLKCNSYLMSVLRPYEKTKLDLLRKPSDSEDSKKTLKKLYKNANLVLYYGKKAVMVLTARGIGPDTAAKLLSKPYTEEELLRAILDVEINYAKTREFWD